jgi:Uma2 family endonuclease
MKSIDDRTYTGGGQYVGPGNYSFEHQDSIVKLCFLLRSAGFDAVPEVLIRVARQKYIPDVVVYQNGKPVLIIEVADSHSSPTDCIKIRHMVDRSRSINEAFVYRYDTKLWVRYNSQAGYEESNSFSQLLKLDLKAVTAA